MLPAFDARVRVHVLGIRRCHIDVHYLFQFTTKTMKMLEDAMTKLTNYVPHYWV